MATGILVPRQAMVGRGRCVPVALGPAAGDAVSRSSMSDKVRIALDAMGGDFGPSVVVPGAQISLERHRGIEFLLFGDRALIEPLVEARPQLKAASQIIHTDVAIAMDAKPSQALRQ